MPFRTRAKNLFKSRSNRSDSQSSSSRNSSSNQHTVYKPGEEMPPPKYRRPPQKEHKDKLEAFSFADAWRKKSLQSLHSPMGTRASSRRQSMRSLQKGRKSVTVMRGEDEEEEGDVVRNDGVEDAADAKKGTEPAEEVDEDGVLTGPLSYVNSKDAAPRTNGVPNGLHKTMSTAHDHQPFSEQDIASAMQRSKMEVSAMS